MRETEDIETARVEYDRLMTMLAERNAGYGIWVRGAPPGIGESPLVRLMRLAEQDGMNIREGVRLMNLGRQWWNSRTMIDREDLHGFLPLPMMQLWIALRRG